VSTSTSGSKGPTGPKRPSSKATSTKRSGAPAGASGGGGTSRAKTVLERSAAKSFRTRHPVFTVLTPVILVVAVIATMVVIKATGGSATAQSSHLQASDGQASAADTTVLSSTVLSDLSVPAATLDEVGSPDSDTLPSAVSRTTVLKGADGKALITYVGAEYCPYCAAERWSLAIALSRFGTLSGLAGTHSSTADVYPDTQTLSFYKASYSSAFLDFQSVEEAGNQEVGGTYPTLQTPTAAQEALLSTYDTAGSIPFLDIANKYVITGASYSPQVLQGLTREQIASDLSNPSSAVAKAIDGTANDITAAICNVTSNQPSSVCDSAAIAAIAKKLAA
jgi:hypothetical protein